MNSMDARKDFLDVIRREFPSVVINSPEESEGDRISPYVPNKRRDKRWMQIDASPDRLFVAMDHADGDIKEEDIKKLELIIGANGKNSSITLKGKNAVNLSIFNNEPYDFNSDEFIAFLRKHYKSYIKRVDVGEEKAFLVRVKQVNEYEIKVTANSEEEAEELVWESEQWEKGLYNDSHSGVVEVKSL